MYSIIDTIIAIVANIDFYIHSSVIVEGIRVNAFIYYTILPMIICSPIAILAGTLLYKSIEKISKKLKKNH